MEIDEIKKTVRAREAYASQNMEYDYYTEESLIRTIELCKQYIMELGDIIGELTDG